MGNHWYKQDGSPCYEVPYADKKKGMRATTIRDARKLNLVPSVTTILQVMDKPGLNNWLQDRVLESALTLPRKENEPDKAYMARIKKDSKELSSIAMNEGTKIHDACEKIFKGEEPIAYRDIARKVKDKIINKFGSEWEAERSFATDTYGGKVDLSKYHFVIDYKTKEKFTKKMAYDEHLMQLVAYGLGLGYSLIETKYVNVFISWEGDIVIHQLFNGINL
jgi:hypothetical protein